MLGERNHIRQTIIDITKLLGVIITSDLKWHENTKYIVKKANKKMIMLHKFAKFTRYKSHLLQKYQGYMGKNGFKLCKEISETGKVL